MSQLVLSVPGIFYDFLKTTPFMDVKDIVHKTHKRGLFYTVHLYSTVPSTQPGSALHLLEALHEQVLAAYQGIMNGTVHPKVKSAARIVEKRIYMVAGSQERFRPVNAVR